MEEILEEGYVAGTCNLGKDEIRRRMWVGYSGLILSAIVFLILEITDAPRLYRIFIFPAVFYSLSGFIQARHKFCFVYGWKGIFNLTGRKQFHKVVGKENLQKDRLTALMIVSMITFGSGLFTALYMVI